ncbi:MAG: four helix bundle protein [Bacteroidales bacterium]|nr:four helix bundle protein [Bacteroidales bacterium]
MSAPLDIEVRTFDFALRVIKLCRYRDAKPGVERTLARQLLRSGTSVGANVEEARAAYSKSEFTCKMIITLKKSRETRYWLRLLVESGIVEHAQLAPLITEATEIMKIIGAIASKSRRPPP